MAEVCALVKASVVGAVTNCVTQVIVTQTFRNESDSAADCTVLVPFGAYQHRGVVCDWLVERHGAETLAEVMAVKSGNAKFRSATSGSLYDRVRSMVREPTFVCSIGNLLPGEEASIKFQFLTPLEATPDGALRLVVPLTFGSGDASSKPVEVEISLTVTSDSDIRFVDSPTHALLLQENARRRKRVLLRERQQSQQQEFVLRVGTSLDKPVAFVEKSAVGGAMSALVCFRVPPLPTAAAAVTVVVLIDGGALGTAELKKQCAEFLAWFMGGLTRSELSLVFVGCDTIVRLESVDGIKAALAKFLVARPESETIQEALSRVYEKFASAPVVKVVLVSDGEGFDLPSALAKVASYVHKYRVFAFGVGSYVRPVLDAVVRAGDGRAEYPYAREKAQPSDTGDTAQKAQSLARCVEQAAAAVHVDWGNLNPLLHPTALWDHGGAFSGDLLFALATLSSPSSTAVPPATTTVTLSVTHADMATAPAPLAVVVDSRRYVRQDHVLLLASRCVLLDQAAAASGGEVADVVDESIALGLVVPGLTVFVAAVEDPVKSSFLALLSIHPGKGPGTRPQPNGKPFAIVKPAVPAPTFIAPDKKQRSASVLDLARAKPRPGASAPSLALSFSPTSGMDDSDSDESPPMARGKSMDSTSPAGKKQYDVKALLRFRQASLEGFSGGGTGAGGSLVAGSDIVSMQASPKSRAKRAGNRRGKGGGGGGGGGGGNPVSPSRSPSSPGFMSSPARPAKQPLLVVSEHAWRPKKLAADNALLQDMAKLRGILNKVTSEKLEFFLKQMLSVKLETPAHLRGLVELVFERVLSAQSMTPLYAELCHKISARCPTFTEDGSEVSFRRLLLNRCQREFEDKNTAIAAAGNLTVGDMIEVEFKMKRRMLGNIRFVGELFRFGMLGHTIVASCCASLLPADRFPDVEDLEVLCNLLMTTGQMLEKASDKMGDLVRETFVKLQKLSVSPQLEARIRFKLQDLIDFRANGWKAVDTSVRRRAAPPQAAKKEAVQEVVSVSGKRGSSRPAGGSTKKSPKAPASPASSPSKGGGRSSWGTEGRVAAAAPEAAAAAAAAAPATPSAAASAAHPAGSPTSVTRRRHNQDVEVLEKSARDLLDEYWLSHDADEACACIRELDSPAWLHRMVAITVQAGAGGGGGKKERGLVVKLLTMMHAVGLLDAQLLLRGFEDLLEDLGSLVMDTPVLALFTGSVLGQLLCADVISADSFSAIHFEQYDHDAVVAVLGHAYDELVEGGALRLWRVRVDEIEPDAAKRKRALRKTTHAQGL